MIVFIKVLLKNNQGKFTKKNAIEEAFTKEKKEKKNKTKYFY